MTFVPDEDVTDAIMALPALRERIADKDRAFFKIMELCEKAEKKYFILGTVGILDIISDIDRIAAKACPLI